MLLLKRAIFQQQHEDDTWPFQELASEPYRDLIRSSLIPCRLGQPYPVMSREKSKKRRICLDKSRCAAHFCRMPIFSSTALSSARPWPVPPLEGTITTADELVRFQASHHAIRPETRKVANYREALEWGYEEIQKRPLAGSLILGLHARLLRGVRGGSGAGSYKQQQNYIGDRPDDPIDRALFIPPGPTVVPKLVQQLEQYINGENEDPRVVQCALTHYQFETIHPFKDGNGRVGRLIIILQMIQLGLLSAPLIYPSVYFERTISVYYQRLQDVREHGAWDEWIGFFAEGIRQQALETRTFTHVILGLRQNLHDEIGNVSRRASINAVLDAFFQHPVLSLSEVTRQARMARHSAQKAVDLLQEHDIVYEMTGKEKGRVYACRPVLDAIFRGAVRNP